MARQRKHYGIKNHFQRGYQTSGKTLEDLRAMGEHVVQAAKDALREHIHIIVDDAKSRCPVKTGRLRDSIHAVPLDDGTAYAIVADAKSTTHIRLRNADGSIMRDKKTGNPVTRSEDFYYGQAVEFDPRINNHPFLYPAFEAHAEEVKNKVLDAINAAINRGI